jgi:hypothetical protein
VIFVLDEENKYGKERERELHNSASVNYQLFIGFRYPALISSLPDAQSSSVGEKNAAVDKSTRAAHKIKNDTSNVLFTFSLDCDIMK